MTGPEMPAGRGPVEPSAALRELAGQLHQMFVALVAEGFTEPQALIVIGHVLRAARGDQ